MHNLLLLHFFISNDIVLYAYTFFFFIIDGMLRLEMCMCVQY